MTSICAAIHFSMTNLFSYILHFNLVPSFPFILHYFLNKWKQVKAIKGMNDLDL